MRFFQKNLAVCLAVLLGFHVVPNRISNVQKPGLHVLFVGNSLSYTNHLPGIVGELAKQAGRDFRYEEQCFPDYSLEDHLLGSALKTLLETGHYDFIVAQQGPSALPESQVVLHRDAARLAALCQKNGAQLALYTVWPAQSRLFDLDNVVASYTTAAQKTGALLCPAGLAWKMAWQTDATLPLYGPDRFHPSMMGSVLAGLTIYGALTGTNSFDFIDFGRCSWRSDMSEGQWKLLKQSASAALGQ